MRDVVLVGEQLSSVIFVQDYLQLDFDGLGLTLNVWPVIELGGGERKVFGDAGYRDLLCSFIAKLVESVRETEKEIEISFAAGKLRIDLTTPGEPVEKVVLEDSVTHRWAWWGARR